MRWVRAGHMCDEVGAVGVSSYASVIHGTVTAVDGNLLVLQGAEEGYSWLAGG